MKKKLKRNAMNYEMINRNLYRILSKKYPDQCKRVFEQECCDIDGSFLGFVDTYYYLSKLIPKHWSVIDFGCAYAAQSYYFRNHLIYIGVCPAVKERFKFDNTIHWIETIKEWHLRKPEVHNDEIFAICNYVPSSETELIRKTFKNCYIFYPHGGFNPMITNEKETKK